mmetsp:Transcript_12411/g.32427  ORF Transcript_12411/g.32427 Transcript_12411/m.32427 type:complete len:292 (+) Transcript_12411:946-1821(+)
MQRSLASKALKRESVVAEVPPGLAVILERVQIAAGAQEQRLDAKVLDAVRGHTVQLCCGAFCVRNSAQHKPNALEDVRAALPEGQGGGSGSHVLKSASCEGLCALGQIEGMDACKGVEGELVRGGLEDTPRVPEGEHVRDLLHAVRAPVHLAEVTRGQVKSYVERELASEFQVGRFSLGSCLEAGPTIRVSGMRQVPEESAQDTRDGIHRAQHALVASQRTDCGLGGHCGCQSDAVRHVGDAVELSLGSGHPPLKLMVESGGEAPHVHRWEHGNVPRDEHRMERVHEGGKA